MRVWKSDTAYTETALQKQFDGHVYPSRGNTELLLRHWTGQALGKQATVASLFWY